MVGYKEVHKVVMEVQEPLPISTVVLVAMVQIPAAVVVAVQEVRWAREEMVATEITEEAVASAAEEVAEMAAAQAHQTWGQERALVRMAGTMPRQEEGGHMALLRPAVPVAVVVVVPTVVHTTGEPEAMGLNG